MSLLKYLELKCHLPCLVLCRELTIGEGPGLRHTAISLEFSSITRYTREAGSPFGREIELIVGNVWGLELVLR